MAKTLRKMLPRNRISLHSLCEAISEEISAAPVASMLALFAPASSAPPSALYNLIWTSSGRTEAKMEVPMGGLRGQALMASALTSTNTPPGLLEKIDQLVDPLRAAICAKFWEL